MNEAGLHVTQTSCAWFGKEIKLDTYSHSYIFIYTATHRDTHIHTHSYRATQNTILYIHNHIHALIYTATHTHSQTHKDSHRDTDTDYTIVHEMGEGIRRAVEGRGRKSEYQKSGSGGGTVEALTSNETSLGLLTVANM